MNTDITIVLVGCGAISHSWLTAITQLQGISVIGLVDSVSDKAMARAKEFGLSAAIGSSLTRMLRTVRPTVVFDCTTADARLSIASAALAHGCHVLAEKPLAPSLDEARRIVADAQAHGKWYATIQNYRYQSGSRRLARFLREGCIGAITSCHSRFSIGARFTGFRARMKHVVLRDMAIHTFDLARMFIGSEPTSVYCKEWNPAGSWYDHGAGVAAIFEFENDVVYTYQGSWCDEGLRTSWGGDWRITGRLGTVLWDGADRFQSEVVAETGGFMARVTGLAVPPHNPEDIIGGHAGVIADFIDCIKRGRRPETACDDNISSLRMVLAAIESSASGRPVSIPPDTSRNSSWN